VADKDPLILDFRNGRMLDGSDSADEPVNWDDIDLEEAFDVPPVLPPVRLPEEAELAAQARRSALLADLRALADEVRKTTVQTATVAPVLFRLAEEDGRWAPLPAGSCAAVLPGDAATHGGAGPDRAAVGGPAPAQHATVTLVAVEPFAVVHKAAAQITGHIHIIGDRRGKVAQRRLGKRPAAVIQGVVQADTRPGDRRTTADWPASGVSARRPWE
jgi:hypothetical protein